MGTLLSTRVSVHHQSQWPFKFCHHAYVHVISPNCFFTKMQTNIKASGSENLLCPSKLIVLKLFIGAVEIAQQLRAPRVNWLFQKN